MFGGNVGENVCNISTVLFPSLFVVLVFRCVDVGVSVVGEVDQCSDCAQNHWGQGGESGVWVDS